MHTFAFTAPDVSRAWLEACTRLAELPRKEAFHTVVRITDPLGEIAHLRTELERLRAARKEQLYPIDTVVNTLFPVQLAATVDTHEELTDRYRALYPRLKKVQRNAHGTYFGRLVAYPGTAEKPEPVDQLARVIRRLKQLRSSSRWRSVYEAGTAHVLDEGEEATWAEEPPATAAGTEAVVRASALDTQPRDFPCLSHCSFQLDAPTGTLHLAAYYRSHYMFERAYGNYLALGHLCAWVARHADLQPGMLTVMAGCARWDGTKAELHTLQEALTTTLFDLG
ncbi:hypothetical protein [Streptomyces ochraceiscleroticus]|uniref:Thymidylate synthase n=1 Tax=Streptomyces ochraceiscleroticus TaxID=47761 RepID=A0ABW1MVF3_9ACTN|nr:hypothetical protein [Streptomyces ochraceiscleroticus]